MAPKTTEQKIKEAIAPIINMLWAKGLIRDAEYEELIGKGEDENKN